MENSFQIEVDASISEGSSHFVSCIPQRGQRRNAGCRKYRHSDFVLHRDLTVAGNRRAR
jgi:hypothetical protein